MKKYLYLLIFSLPFIAPAQVGKVQTFSLASVRLLDGPFKVAQQTDMRYMLELDVDRLLAPFVREAGLKPQAERYGNWENTGLDGHIGGHYISALSNMYASTGDVRMKQRLDYMVNWLDSCQRQNPNGYVGGIPGGNAMWNDIAAGKIKADGFSLNGKWVPLYNIHKLFAGLIDAYKIAGNQKAKTVLIKLADWFYNITANLSDQQIQTMLRSEHGGINEAFADIAGITGNNKYLLLAERLSHKTLLEPLLKDEDKLNGMHANTQIPKVIGFMRVAELSGDTTWANAAKFFWQTVTENRTISIGGNSVREHFNPANNFASMIETKEGPETCNTYNMLKLTKHLFLSEPSADYMDFYERALYNHILSSQRPEGGFVYFTPIRPNHYRVYSQPQEDFWCCVGSGLENHGKYGELIYAHTGNDLYVNLFIPSTLQWKEKGITVEQQNNFPNNASTQLKLTLKKPQQFSVYLRKPKWVSGDMRVLVNGKNVAAKSAGDGYVYVNRAWKTGDAISLQLPMQTKAEFLPDGSPWFSFVRGPFVLAAKTSTNNLDGLVADGSRMGHVANGPLYPIEEAPMIVANDSGFVNALQPVKNKPFSFTAASVIQPNVDDSLQLVPFYTIQNARYMVYWRYATPQQFSKIKEDMRLEEEKKLAVEAMTLDQVAPGEQQPESDHHFLSDRTETGVFKDRHWRSAKGWFSYDLKNTNHLAKKLRVTYYGGDRGREFDIMVNDQLIKSVSLNGSGGDLFFDVDYTLPENVVEKSDKLTVKFVAKDGSTAGGVYYVRLLK